MAGANELASPQGSTPPDLDEFIHMDWLQDSMSASSSDASSPRSIESPVMSPVAISGIPASAFAEQHRSRPAQEILINGEYDDYSGTPINQYQMQSEDLFQSYLESVTMPSKGEPNFCNPNAAVDIDFSVPTTPAGGSKGLALRDLDLDFSETADLTMNSVEQDGAPLGIDPYLLSTSGIAVDAVHTDTSDFFVKAEDGEDEDDEEEDMYVNSSGPHATEPTSDEKMDTRSIPFDAASGKIDRTNITNTSGQTFPAIKKSSSRSGRGSATVASGKASKRSGTRSSSVASSGTSSHAEEVSFVSESSTSSALDIEVCEVKPFLGSQLSHAMDNSALKTLPKTSVLPFATPTLHQTSARSTLPPVPEWTDKPDPETYKKLTPQEKRQLRNKISARNFRHRKKEYITTLEEEIASRDAIISDLEDKVNAVESENIGLKVEMSGLRESFDELMAKMKQLAIVPPSDSKPFAPIKAEVVDEKDLDWALDSPKIDLVSLPALAPPSPPIGLSTRSSRVPLSSSTNANATASTSSSRHASSSSIMQKPNMKKDISSRGGSNWAGRGMGLGLGGNPGGFMSVHTALVPDVSLLNTKGSAYVTTSTKQLEDENHHSEDIVSLFHPQPLPPSMCSLATDLMGGKQRETFGNRAGTENIMSDKHNEKVDDLLAFQSPRSMAVEQQRRRQYIEDNKSGPYEFFASSAASITAMDVVMTAVVAQLAVSSLIDHMLLLQLHHRRTISLPSSVSARPSSPGPTDT